MCIAKDTAYDLILQCARLKDVSYGRTLHSQIISSSIKLVPAIGDQLIRLFGSTGTLLEANLTFCNIVSPNVFSWHAIIHAYELHGASECAIELYHKMHQEGVAPDKFVFTSALRACGSIEDVEEGKLMHDLIVRSSLDGENVVANSLVYMYAKCKCLKEATKVFWKSPCLDVVAWSTIITGYAEKGCDSIALELFQKMQKQGIEPDRIMYLCVLKLCGSMGDLNLGKVVHNQIQQSGQRADITIGNALIDMYVKCGSIEEAQKTFKLLPYRDAVSYTTMILGFTEYGMGFSAVSLFEKMLEEGIQADRVTLLCILRACSSIGALKKGMRVHNCIVTDSRESDLAVGSTIVDMYSRCGDLCAADRVLKRLANRNIVSWNAMITGYANHADYSMVLQGIEDMRAEGLELSPSTFSILLAACSHAGQVSNGYSHFVSMRKEYSIMPNSEHYLCIIDLLSRSGCLDEAKQLLYSMPDIKDYSGWMSLLTGCRKYGSVEIGQHCFDRIAEMNPKDGSCYMLMSSIYSDAEMWNEFEKLHEDKGAVQAWKKPGQAWIEIEDKIYEFFVDDMGHPEMFQMLSKISMLKNSMKSEGYIIQSSSLMELL